MSGKRDERDRAYAQPQLDHLDEASRAAPDVGIAAARDSSSTIRRIQRSDGQDRLASVTASMLWAAWADALGFISELTDATGLNRRLAGRSFADPLDWRRRVGGRFGVQADLPAGCYSDDTQLRLATGRAISGHGFDVEAFARVELTVWPTYALGGGLSSRAAATAMSKSRATWFTNFYDGWHRGGGNGVAMRVQPHVWAAEDLATDRWLEDVLTNGSVTHGHPRALVGAGLAAAAVAFALRERRRPIASDWAELINTVSPGYEIMQRRTEIAAVWLPSWEQAAGEPFRDAWAATIKECQSLHQAIAPLVQDLSSCVNQNSDVDSVWGKLLQSLRLFDDATRGSGTGTAMAALALAAAFSDPAAAARCAARAVGSDTDTIGTIAAAILGAAAPLDSPAPRPIQDETYLRQEASRLNAIALGETASMHSYPDLLRWTPPQSQLDGVGRVGNDGLALAGLGYLTPLADPIRSKDACWQWMRADFGPSMLVKRRAEPRALASGSVPPQRDQATRRENRAPARPSTETVRLNSPTRTATPSGLRESRTERRDAPRPLADLDRSSDDTGAMSTSANTIANRPSERVAVNVDQMLEWVQRNNYSDSAVGYAVMRISSVGTVEQLVAFTISMRERLALKSMGS